MVASHTAIDGSRTAERGASVNKSIDVNRSIDQQHATVDIRFARVCIDAREAQGSRANLSQRATGTALHSTILNHAGERGAHIVADDSQIIGSQKNVPI